MKTFVHTLDIHTQNSEAYRALSYASSGSSVEEMPLRRYHFDQTNLPLKIPLSSSSLMNSLMSLEQ